MSRAPTQVEDRGAWRLVAARDFWVRLRDKGFIISTAITLSVLTMLILLSAFGSDSPDFARHRPDRQGSRRRSSRPAWP